MRSAPADKVDNLQAISVVEFGPSPLSTRDNFAIQFDRNAIALHSKLLDQLRQRESAGKTLLVTIDE